MSTPGEKSRAPGPAPAGKGWIARTWGAFVDHTSRGVRIVIGSVTALVVTSASLLAGLDLLPPDDAPKARPFVSGRMDGGPVFINGQPVFVGDDSELLKELLGMKKPAEERGDEVPLGGTGLSREN